MDVSGLTVAQIAQMVVSGEITKKAAESALAQRAKAKLDRALAVLQPGA